MAPTLREKVLMLVENILMQKDIKLLRMKIKTQHMRKVEKLSLLVTIPMRKDIKQQLAAKRRIVKENMDNILIVQNIIVVVA
jgi:hypothetical protein